MDLGVFTCRPIQLPALRLAVSRGGDSAPWAVQRKISHLRARSRQTLRRRKRRGGGRRRTRRRRSRPAWRTQSGACGPPRMSARARARHYNAVEFHHTQILALLKISIEAGFLRRGTKAPTVEFHQMTTPTFHITNYHKVQTQRVKQSPGCLPLLRYH